MREEQILLDVAQELASLCEREIHPQRLLPAPKDVVGLLKEVQSLLYPAYFSSCDYTKDHVCYLERLGVLYWRLTRLIHSSIAKVCHPTCNTNMGECLELEESRDKAMEIVRELPNIKRLLDEDVQAAYRGDPAARDVDEIILAYPGFFAIFTYRLANEFQKRDLELIARIMSEYAHSKTGIDIHPGATIGRGFFIDHGTGVVIGETTIIGDNVKVYQGVTLGALSFPKDHNGNLIRGTKRHPTIEDNVTIYAGATILGGETVVGEGAVIGGNVWLTESVPPRCKVINKPLIEKKE